jgi:diguanylate cyclase (GGDEF)-like protein
LTQTGRQLSRTRRRRPATRKPASGGRADLASRLQRLQAALRRRWSRADTLAEMIRAVNASLDPERVADALVSRTAEWVPAPGWLVLARDDAGAIRQMAMRALTPALDEAATAVGGWVMRTGEMFLSADVSADRRLLRIDKDAVAAAVGLPLACRGGTVGALVAIDRARSSREPRFDRATLAVLTAALEPGALALDNAMRVQRAEALSVTDDLTQLYNSRYLSQVLRRETKRASRSNRPLSLLVIDLDGFKSINDSHGHLYGSRALVEAASVIRASARETDIVARFGGDEFALVLPDTGSDGAMFVGERIREKIAAWSFLRSDGLNISLTVSVGVATLPDVASTAEQLIQAADEAMYEVKDRGKNGIHVAC